MKFRFYQKLRQKYDQLVWNYWFDLDPDIQTYPDPNPFREYSPSTNKCEAIVHSKLEATEKIMIYITDL